MEPRRELGPVVGPYHEHPERQPAPDFVDELNRRTLIAGVIDLEHANPRAVVDCGELTEALRGAGNAFEELDVELQTMSRLRLLVALPSLPMRPMLLIGGQPLVSDSAGAKMIVLSKIENLADDFPRRGARRS